MLRSREAFAACAQRGCRCPNTLVLWPHTLLSFQVVVEQDQLTSGTTWHAAGLIGMSRATATEVKVCSEGVELYKNLAADTGLDSGYKQCGSITVARSADRMAALRRAAGRAKGFGIEAELVDADRCVELWKDPTSGVELMSGDGLHGGLWLPGDGTADPSGVTMAMAGGARQRGVKIVQGTRVEKFDLVSANGRVRANGVFTNRGHITADKVVLCGGQWSRQLGAQAGVAVPLHSAEHYYIVTTPMKGVFGDLPVMRDPDVFVYFREFSGGLLMGGFEPDAKPIFSEGVPSDFAFSLLPDDWDQFQILYDGAVERVPALAKAEVRQFVNGPESFTVDNQYMLGETPEVGNLFVAAGFNSSGIASGAGAGKVLAEWMIGGEPPCDLWNVDIRRCGPFLANTRFLRERTKETLGLHYAMPWPRREMASERKLRLSPLYGRLTSSGACWGQKFGWERPNWFAPVGTEPKQRYTFGRPDWHDAVGAEHQNTRERVSLFDQSSFSKIQVEGRDAEKALQRICANNVAVEVGDLVYTGMLNKRGGYESDITVMRTALDRYLVITSTAQGTRDLDWIKRNLGDDFVVATDVTTMYATISVMGPRARDLLSKVSMADLSNEAFPFGTQRLVDVGNVMVRAARVTYVGELGWELHCPVEQAHGVYDALYAADAEAEYGLRNAGYYSIDSLRTEKAYRAWGHDITPDYTPLEAGLSFAVAWDKGDFIGRDALLRQRDEGVKRRLANFVLEDPLAHPWGDEPILRNGEVVGSVSTANYGHTVGGAVCLGYVNHEDVGERGFLKKDGAVFEIEVDGAPVRARARFLAPYDPKGLAVKG